MVYRFGDCTLDPRRHQLQRAGRLVRLRPKAFEVLLYVVEHRDRAVLKSELYAQVWPTQFISEATLESTVRAMRQAIGDSGRAQRLIQTVYGYGYRFVAAVEVRPDAPPPDADRHAALSPWTSGSAGGDDRPRALGQTDEPEQTFGDMVVELASERPPVPSPVWEWKPVAVLVVEFTFPTAAWSEPPTDGLYSAAGRCEQSLVTAVQAVGGVVLQRAPSLLLVAFGIPRTLDQLPQRAVQAALTLRQLVAEGTAQAPGLEVRLAVDWGPLLVDAQAGEPAAQIRPVGDTLARPVRLLGQAGPGEILLSPALGRLVDGWYEVQPRRAPGRTGGPGRVGAYAVVGDRPAGAWHGRRRRRPLTPFVGRDRELATLRARLGRVARGRGQLVGVMGEPGIGKSRLCDEFLRGVAASAWRILATQGTAVGEATPYLPIVHLLQGYFRLDGRDDRATVRDRVTAHLRGLDDTLTDAAPALLTLLEVPVDDPPWQALDARQRRQRTLDALKRLLVRESQARPVLLVVEDLHWIDAETQACLDALVDSLPSARLLLLVTYRPEYRHDWSYKPAYTPLRLDPLPPTGADTLVRSLLGDDPSLAPLTPLLTARTGGNPFFAEESVRTLAEAGVLAGGCGHYRLAQTPPTIEVPATVQAVLAARIDRLPPEAKRLLQTAAVIGPEVPLALLQAIAVAPDEGLRRGLSRLQAAAFLYERRLLPEVEYAFTHALTQEVAYGSVVPERRRALHARIVGALEAMAGDELGEPVERLAHHALRGEVWEKAVSYCQQAGEKARNRGAVREAVTSFDQAIDALGHLPDHADTGVLAIELRYRLGGMLSSVGAHARSLTLLGEAAARARQLDDRGRLGRALARMVTVRGIVGDVDGALAAAQEAMDLATTLGEPALHVHAAYRLGQVYVNIGDYRRAAEVLRGNVAVLTRSTRGDMRVRCIKSQAWLAEVLSLLGEFAEGRHHGEEALRLIMVEGREDARITARARLGCLYLAQGDLDPAIRVFEEGLALCRASGQKTSLWAILGGLGEAYAHTERLAEGLTLLEEARRDDLRTGRLGGSYVTNLRQLSAVYLLAGRVAEARQHACQALDRARQLKARGDEAHALFQLGAAQAEDSPLAARQAEARYREALTLAEALGMRPLQAHCHRGLGTFYARMGWREQSCAELSTALALYRAMAMTFWLPQVEAALAMAEAW